mmetsp:Transcript_136410/g.291320  ORF Transcript_136410/g.291320 Transcript_136410/m.291320 type:complete len:212 (-) Transcript_136410:3246-3881(-)
MAPNVATRTQLGAGMSPQTTRRQEMPPLASMSLWTTTWLASSVSGTRASTPRISRCATTEERLPQGRILVAMAMRTTAMVSSALRSGTTTPTGIPRLGMILPCSPTSHRAVVPTIVQSHRMSRPRAPAASRSLTTPELASRAMVSGRRPLPSRSHRQNAWAVSGAVTTITEMYATVTPSIMFGASPATSKVGPSFASATTLQPWTSIPRPP